MLVSPLPMVRDLSSSPVNIKAPDWTEKSTEWSSRLRLTRASPVPPSLGILTSRLVLPERLPLPPPQETLAPPTVLPRLPSLLPQTDPPTRPAAGRILL